MIHKFTLIAEPYLASSLSQPCRQFALSESGVNACVCVCVCVCVCAWLGVCGHIYKCHHAHTNTHKHTQTHTNTHKHTQTYTHTQHTPPHLDNSGLLQPRLPTVKLECHTHTHTQYTHTTHTHIQHIPHTRKTTLTKLCIRNDGHTHCVNTLPLIDCLPLALSHRHAVPWVDG